MMRFCAKLAAIDLQMLATGLNALHNAVRGGAAMLLKNADDKSKRLALLEDLQNSPLLDAKQKKWLDEQLINVRKGMQGEREAAFHVDSVLRDSKYTAVLHDLRFVFENEVAQIDHMLINRASGFFLVETKNYAGNVRINTHGEFTVDYGGRQFGVPSPLEQSRRHERVLRKLLDRLEIKNRIGTPIEFHHVVLFHPKAIITRPRASELDTSDVIKADQFGAWLKSFVEKDPSVVVAFVGLANLRSPETVREWGEKLIRQHRPDDPLALPEFMRPKERAPVAVKTSTEVPSATPREKRLICLQCSKKISFAEGRFCWSNEARFKGGQYCREHQTAF
jgi:hypothetical protein